MSEECLMIDDQHTRAWAVGSGVTAAARVDWSRAAFQRLTWATQPPVGFSLTDIPLTQDQIRNQ